MRDEMQARLEELRGELAAGERRMAELDAERQELQAVMLRISGAVQVIEEMLGERASNGAAPVAAAAEGGAN